MFKVEEIKKSFKDKEVLKGVSFSVEEGDRVALLGNNGAGKSTLLKVISGILKPTTGEVKISGNISPLTDALKWSLNLLLTERRKST